MNLNSITYTSNRIGFNFKSRHMKPHNHIKNIIILKGLGSFSKIRSDYQLGVTENSNLLNIREDAFPHKEYLKSFDNSAGYLIAEI